uniref:Uncharacterized protein n=1 Tax=Meloidogyne hapla TaxID=6305 RepID=A0A1I8BWY5_MELHA
MRHCFLPENWLVHSPEGGYLRGRRASAESQRYIRLFELENTEAAGKVQCAQWAIGEANVEDSGFRLDGLWFRSPPLRPLAIEYMGCYYHGCPQCFPIRNHRRNHLSNFTTFVRTMWRYFTLTLYIFK